MNVYSLGITLDYNARMFANEIILKNIELP